MEKLRFHPLLEVSSEEVSLVRDSINMDAEDMEKAVDVILEWWRKEEHLAQAMPTNIERSICERFIIISRGSLETSKRKIEKFLTTRSLLPDLSLNMTFEEFDNFVDNMFLLPLPKTNPADHTRVTLIRVISEDFFNFCFLTEMRFIFLVGNYRMYFDYIFSDRFILDFKNYKLSMFLTVSPVLAKRLERFIMDVYGVRVKGIHIVNAPAYVDKVVHLLKFVLNEKIAKRIHIHDSLDDLYKFIDRDILPEDYGGQQPSLRRLTEHWKEYFRTDEAKQLLDCGNRLHSDESKRSDVKFNEEYLGLPGSFKQINNID